MKCPNHPNDDLKVEDFYWHNDGNKTLKSRFCKKCISKKDKEKRKEKSLDKMFYA